MSFLPWTEKYRPKSLKEIVGHEKVIKRIKGMIEKRNIPNLMFSGPPGCGKTTLAWCIAIECYGNEEMAKLNTIELNASDERKIDDIRTKIKPYVQTLPLYSQFPFKLIILDEAEEITRSAQQALRRMMEPENATTRFILCCNDSSKIIEPLLSRVKHERLSPLPLEYMKKFLNHIAVNEGIVVMDGVYDILFEEVKGDLRKAINIFQSSVENGRITKESIMERMELPEESSIEELLSIGMKGDYVELSSKIGKMIFQKGWSSDRIVKAMSRYLTKKYCKLPDEVKLRLAEKLLEISPFDKEIQLNAVMAHLCRLSLELNMNEKKKIEQPKYKCPSCGGLIIKYVNPCPHCNTKLRWE